MEAKIMEETCKDVQIEPELQPTTAELTNSRNRKVKARLDISARGIWSMCEKSFLDVRVTYPNGATNLKKTLTKIYEDHEKEKKAEYNSRVLQTEKASFTPLVFSTTGGMAKECEVLNKRLAEKISHKTNEQYCHVMSFIRTRLRFALLRATLVAVRGYRGKKFNNEMDLEEMSYNLIPQAPSAI